MADEHVIRNFIGAWSRLNVAELVAFFFTSDGTYHNRMLKPVTGQAALEQLIGGFIKDWTETQWDVLAIASNGNVVFAERLDRTRVGTRSVVLPCCGAFEMENGKIKVWRDYFDLATYNKAIREPA